MLLFESNDLLKFFPSFSAPCSGSPHSDFDSWACDGWWYPRSQQAELPPAACGWQAMKSGEKRTVAVFFWRCYTYRILQISCSCIFGFGETISLLFWKERQLIALNVSLSANRRISMRPSWSGSQMAENARRSQVIIWKRFEIVASYKCTKQNKVLCPFPSWTKLFNGPTWGCKPYVTQERKP